jgi:fatty acid desaturase
MPEGGETARDGLLRHREDRWNLIRATTTLPILMVPAVFGLPEGAAGLAWGLLLWFSINDANLVLHQHVHRPLTHSVAINGVLDTLLSLTTGMSAYAWRQHHVLRHHRGDDSWTYAQRWEIERASVLGALSYSVRYGLLMVTLPLAEAFVLGMVRRVKSPINYRRAFVQQAVVVSFVGALCIVLPEFYVPYFGCVYFFTALTDYQNHVGCDGADFNFANNMLRSTYNRVRDNFGYHTAHHCFPDAHWTHLPAIHARIQHRIPPARLGRGWWIGQLSVPAVFHGIAWLVRVSRGSPAVVTK